MKQDAPQPQAPNNGERIEIRTQAEFEGFILSQCEGLQRQVIADINRVETIMSKPNLTREEIAEAFQLHQAISATIMSRADEVLAGMGASITRIQPETTEIDPEKDPILEDINIEGTSRASATARLFKSPWSPDFAHGPDTLLPIGDLMTKILRPGETLKTLKRISWRSLMVYDLHLQVFEGDIGDKPEEKYTLDGVFETNQGRKLSFTGKDIKDSKISKCAGRNGIAEEIIDYTKDYLRKNIMGIYEIQLTTPSKEYINGYELSAGMQFATLAEIVVTILVDANKSDNNGPKNKLMIGLNNLTLPSCLEDLTRKGSPFQLRINYEKAKIGKSGMEMRPFQYKFPHQSTPSTGLMAITDSAEITKKCYEQRDSK